MVIDKYKDELLQSFLDNYCRIYLIDLEKDTIVKILEAEGENREDPVKQKKYSEFNRIYSYSMLEPEYSAWREMMGSIENIRKVLADRNSFTVSYQMKDGRWMKVENRILEKKGGVPVKVFACIPKEEKGQMAENEKILKEGIANIAIIGTKEEIEANGAGFDLTGATIIDPITDPKS